MLDACETVGQIVTPFGPASCQAPARGSQLLHATHERDPRPIARGSGKTGRMFGHGASLSGANMRARSAELANMASARGLPEHMVGFLKAQRILSVGLTSALADSYKEVD